MRQARSVQRRSPAYPRTASNPCLISVACPVQVEKNVSVKITGNDKAVVGDFAAKIRAKRPPEPYKQKGVRYVDEVVRKKEGKRGK